MSKEKAKAKEPFVRIVKRDGTTMGNKILARAVSILLALVVDAVFIYSVTGLNPLAVYGVMFNGTFMTSVRFSWAMRDLVTLLTCHPYASGGKQRFLVICERTEA